MQTSVINMALIIFISETTYQKMLFTLSQVEFSFEKTQLVMEMNRLEMARYKELCQEIGEEFICLCMYAESFEICRRRDRNCAEKNYYIQRRVY